mgnify:CR=1 FL=1
MKFTQAGFPLAFPNFDGIQPSKEASDWNDLIRLKGEDIARSQMLEALRSANLLPDQNNILILKL